MTSKPAPHRPFSRLTGRLIAEMQLQSIVVLMRLLDSNLTRAFLFMLMLRDNPRFGGADRIASGRKTDGVTAQAAALALDRPLDAVARQIQAMITEGFCSGGAQAAKITPAMLEEDRYIEAMVALHDIMVRLIVHLRTFGVALPERQPSERYQPDFTIAAAIDLVLMALDFAEPHFRTWHESYVVNAITAANARPVTFNTRLAFRYSEWTTPAPAEFRQAVQPGAIASAILLPECRVRAIARRAVADGRLDETTDGYLVTTSFLNTPI